jgi:hypothetical protein
MKPAARDGRSFPQCSQFLFRLDGEALARRSGGQGRAMVAPIVLRLHTMFEI